MATEIGKLVAVFEADISKFTSASRQVEASMRQTARSVNAHLKQISVNPLLSTLEKGRAAFVSAQIKSAEKAAQGVISAAVREGRERAKVEKDAVAAVRQAEQARIKERRAAQRIIAGFERERARIVEENARAIARTERVLNQQRVREARRTATQLANSLRPQGVATSTLATAAAVGGVIGGALGFSIAGLTATVRRGADAWLEYASKLENARIAFTTMLGSARLAEQHLQSLQQFALTTPFDFPELVDASQRMQALGFSAEEVIPILRDVGNAVAAAGGGNERLERTIKALADVRAKEKLQSQEVRQFAEAGISVFKILQEETGKSVTEIQKMIEAGKITSTIFIAAFQKFSQTHFGDLMEQQSKTFTGAMSNIKDVLFQTANTAFEPLFKKISEIAVRLQGQLQGLDAQDIGSVMADFAAEAATIFVEEFVKQAAKGLADPRRWFGPIKAFQVVRGIIRGLEGPAVELGRTLGFVTRPSAPTPLPAAARLLPEFYGKDTRAREAFATQEIKLAENLEKTEGILKSLRLELQFYGEKTVEAATKQKLLASGVSDLTSGLAAEALALAQARDRLDRLIESDARSRETQAKTAEALREQGFQTQKALDDILSPVGEVSQRIKELQATERGGRTEVEKFNESLGLQAGAFLNLSRDALEQYRAKFAEIDRLQAQSAIASKVKELGNEAMRLQHTVEGSIPALKEYELWVRQNAQAARLGADKLEGLKSAFEEVERASAAQRLKQQRIELSKTLSGISTDIENQLRTRPDDPISQLAEKLQGLEFLKLQPFGFEEFVERIRSGALDAKQALALIETALSKVSGDLGVEFEATAAKIVNLFIEAKHLSEFLKQEDASAKYKAMVEQLTSALEADVRITASARVAKELLTDQYKALTDAQKVHLQQLAQEVDNSERIREVVSRIRSFALELTDIFASAIDDGFRRGVKSGLATLAQGLLRIVQDIFLRRLAEGLSNLLSNIAVGGGGGGFVSGLLNAVLSGIGGGASSSLNLGSGSSFTSVGTGVPRVVGRAEGGPIFPGNIYRVHQDETIVPLTPGYVMPKGSGQTINDIKIYLPPQPKGSYTSPRSRRELASAIAAELQGSLA